MTESVFVPLSVVMLATCTDDSVEITAEEIKVPKGTNIEKGIRGGLYYINKLGKKIYIGVKKNLPKAVKKIKVALDTCQNGVDAFKKSGCMEKCKNAIGVAKWFGEKLGDDIKKTSLKIGIAYHGGLKSYYSKKSKDMSMRNETYKESQDFHNKSFKHSIKQSNMKEKLMRLQNKGK